MHSQSLTALVAISAAIGGLASPVAAPAKSTNSSSGEAHLQKRFTGSKWSFYDVGLGACGHTNNENEFVVALNAEQYGSGYPGPHCGESITLRYNGKSATAKIVDRCPGCPYGGLDLSRSLFRHFASEDLGIIYGEWDFGAAGGSGGAAPTSTKAETNSHKPSASTTQQQTTASPAPSAAASSSAPVSEVKTSSSSAPQNTWSTSKAAPSSSAAQSKAPAPSSAAPAPQNTWSTLKAAPSSAAAPSAQIKDPVPSSAAPAPSKSVLQGGNDEEECEEDDEDDKKTTSPGSTHQAADSKPTQTSAVSSQSAAKKTDTPAPTGVNLKVAPSSTQAKPPSTSSSALPSAASAASALPTSDSSDAETVKKNLVLVGEILNSLGDYFDKVFKKESSGRSPNTTVTLRRDD